MFVGKVLQTATAPNQLKSAGSDLRPYVFKLREKCDVACNRNLDNDSGYTEPSSAYCRICNNKANYEVSSDSFLSKLGTRDLDVVLRTSRVRWFGHVRRSTGWIAEVVVVQSED